MQLFSQSVFSSQQSNPIMLIQKYVFKETEPVDLRKSSYILFCLEHRRPHQKVILTLTRKIQVIYKILTLFEHVRVTKSQSKQCKEGQAPLPPTTPSTPRTPLLPRGKIELIKSFICGGGETVAAIKGDKIKIADILKNPQFSFFFFFF